MKKYLYILSFCFLQTKDLKIYEYFQPFFSPLKKSYGSEIFVQWYFRVWGVIGEVGEGEWREQSMENSFGEIKKPSEEGEGQCVYLVCYLYRLFFAVDCTSMWIFMTMAIGIVSGE